MSALIHLSERWSIFGISTLMYSRGPPTYSHTLNDARTLPTVPLAMDIGVGSIVRWKHTGLMVCYRPTKDVVTTKQTSQVTTAPAHTLNRSYWQCLEIGFLSAHPIESVSEPIVVVAIVVCLNI
jgi:hypothetical protein